MKGKYRIIAIVIALTMAFCAMPINVLADDTEQQTQVEETTVEETTAEEIAKTTPINEVPETFPPQTQENTTTPIEESSVVPSEDNEHITDTTTEETFVIVLETIEEETVGSGAVENSSANKTFIPIDMVIGQATVNNTVFTDAYGRAIIDFVEGIYAFENLGNTGFWMDTENSSTSSGAYIQQSAFGATSPVDSFSRNALFKISKQSSTGRYIIRLMTNNKLSFGIEGNKIVTKEIPTVDSEVAIGDTFDIQYSLGGYIIRPYGSQYAICAPNNTSSGTSGSTDSYLYFANPNAVGDRAKWKISMYTGSHRHGTTIYSPWPWAEIGIAVGTTGTLTMKTWSTAIGANTPYVYVQEGSEDMISTSWDFNKSKLTLTAIRPGRATVSAKILYTRSGAAAFTGQARYQILLQKGTHFIKNVATNKCVDIEGPSRAEGAIIQQWTHHSGDQEKWIVEYDNVVGYIRFKSAYSGLYIGVDSSNTSLVKQYSTKNDYTLWRTERTESGNIRLVCKAVTNGYVLAAPSATSGNGADLTMTLYTNDTDYRDEWKIFEDVTFGNLVMNIDDTMYADVRSLCANNTQNPADYNYTVTSGSSHISINSSGRITALSGGTATVTATHKELTVGYTFNVTVNKNAIIIVPGIIGTTLKRATDDPENPYEIVWGDELLNLPDEEIVSRLLSLIYSSNEPPENEIIPYSEDKGARSAYQTLYNSLEREYGDSYDICFFGYDWRLSNAVSADLLDQFINDASYGKVVLVCHSMGGLVASSYLAKGEEQRDKVETAIMLGVPFLGTPVMTYVWGSEDFAVIYDAWGEIENVWMEPLWDVLSAVCDPLDVLLSTFPSVYELFPTQQYFDSNYGGHHYLRTWEDPLHKTDLTTYSETSGVLLTELQLYGLNVLKWHDAIQFHNSLFIGGSHVTELINTHYIASTGHLTVDKVLFTDVLDLGIKIWSNDEETTQGDGVVPIWSATLGDRYYQKTFFVENLGHIDLIYDVAGVLPFINDLIAGNTSTYNDYNIHPNIPE